MRSFRTRITKLERAFAGRAPRQHEGLVLLKMETMTRAQKLGMASLIGLLDQVPDDSASRLLALWLLTMPDGERLRIFDANAIEELLGHALTKREARLPCMKASTALELALREHCDLNDVTRLIDHSTP